MAAVFASAAAAAAAAAAADGGGGLAISSSVSPSRRLNPLQQRPAAAVRSCPAMQLAAWPAPAAAAAPLQAPFQLGRQRAEPLALRGVERRLSPAAAAAAAAAAAVLSSIPTPLHVCAAAGGTLGCRNHDLADNVAAAAATVADVAYAASVFAAGSAAAAAAAPVVPAAAVPAASAAASRTVVSVAAPAAVPRPSKSTLAPPVTTDLLCTLVLLGIPAAFATAAAAVLLAVDQSEREPEERAFVWRCQGGVARPQEVKRPFEVLVGGDESAQHAD